MFHASLPFRWASLVFCVVALLVAGCPSGDGVNRASIKGTVTLDGQPVETGSIAFRPSGQTKGPSAGGTIQDGAYSIDRAQGPVVGTMRVEINATRKTGRQIPDMYQPDRMLDETVEAVPARYNSNSELTLEIQSGRNEQNFELTSE